MCAMHSGFSHFPRRSLPADDEKRQTRRVTIEIGWIDHAAIPLTEQARRYLEEVRTVVAEFGVHLLG